MNISNGGTLRGVLVHNGTYIVSRTQTAGSVRTIHTIFVSDSEEGIDAEIDRLGLVVRPPRVRPSPEEE